ATTAAVTTTRVGLAQEKPRALGTYVRDVCIIGGGASGMYAAMRLRELGYSVVVVEKAAYAGGHSYTHQDAATGLHTEMGVRIYPDVDIIKDTYAKHGVKLVRSKINGAKRIYVEIASGNEGPYKDPNVLVSGYSLLKYNLLFKLKYGYLENAGINLPESVPAELLQPFGEYLINNKLDKGYAPVTHYLQGYGPARKVPTLYALKNTRVAITNSILKDNFWTPEKGTSEIYRVMGEKLGQDLILNAVVNSVTRPEGEAKQIVVNTPTGISVIAATNLIIAFPPLLDRMTAFDLDISEREMVSKFKANYYWTAMVRIENLDPEIVLLNTTGDNVLEGQTFPGMYTAAPTGIPGLVNVLYGSETLMPEDEVKARITTDMEKLNGSFTTGPVKVIGFERFINHTPFGVEVDLPDIVEGFYRRFDAFQGLRGTYYTGAAIDTNDTSSVWTHAENLVTKYFPSKV
ncbi:MAG: NAD(P)/FAD-dependent oxidoreductase, partial [Pseudomonas sp.]